MRTINRMSQWINIWAVGVAFLMVRSANAQVDLLISPAIGDLHMAERPLKGTVLQMTAMWESPNAPGKPMPPKPGSEIRYYRDKQGNTVVVAYGGAYRRVLNPRGQTIWTRSSSNENGRGVFKEVVTTVEYTPEGIPSRIEETVGGQPRIANHSTIEQLRDGTYSARFEIPTPLGTTSFFTYVYDKDGLLKQFRKGGTNMSDEQETNIERNAQGDIQMWTSPPRKRWNKYEYEYDAAGNWTKRTEFEKQGFGEWEHRQTTFRVIKYAKPGEPLPEAPPLPPFESLQKQAQ